MLVLLEELPRLGANWNGEVVAIGCNPDVIDLVVPAEVMGFDGPACQVTMGETVRFVVGDVDQIMALVNACYEIQQAQQDPCCPMEPARDGTLPPVDMFTPTHTQHKDLCEPENSDATASTSSNP